MNEKYRCPQCLDDTTGVLHDPKKKSMRRLNFQLVLLEFIFFVPGIAIRWLAMLRLCVCSTRMRLRVAIIVWVPSLSVVALTWDWWLVHAMSRVAVELVQ